MPFVPVAQVPKKPRRTRVLAAARQGRSAAASFSYVDAFESVTVLLRLREAFLAEKGRYDAIEALSDAWNARHG